MRLAGRVDRDSRDRRRDDGRQHDSIGVLAEHCRPISNGAFAVLAAGVLAATVIDLRTQRIPNELTAAMTGVGIAMAATGVSGISVAGAFLGFALGLVLMLPGYGLGATGAGDVKLMAAVGAIVGPALVVSAFFCTAIAGGVLAVIVALRRRRLGATLDGHDPVDRIQRASPDTDGESVEQVRIRSGDRGRQRHRDVNRVAQNGRTGTQW